jgi:hypothetical protein
MSIEFIGEILGLILTVLILSYVVGDNPLYRLALHLLVGASVGYAVAVSSYTLITRVFIPAIQAEGTAQYSLLIPVLLGILLLFKAVPRLAYWGNISTAFLVGVGTAVAMGGALLGTILPQISASGSILEWARGGLPYLVNQTLIVGGTVCALLAFTFTIQKQPGLRGLFGTLLDMLGRFGRIFLLIAFGAAFATALTASLSVLIGRSYIVAQIIQNLLPSFGG